MTVKIGDDRKSWNSLVNAGAHVTWLIVLNASCGYHQPGYSGVLSQPCISSFNQDLDETDSGLHPAVCSNAVVTKIFLFN